MNFFDLLKTLIICVCIIVICWIIPLKCHVKLGGGADDKAVFEFGIDKTQNTLKPNEE